MNRRKGGRAGTRLVVVQWESWRKFTRNSLEEPSQLVCGHAFLAGEAVESGVAPRFDTLDELLQDGHDHEPPDPLRCQHHFLQYRLFPPSRRSDSKAPMLASILPDVSDASFENFNYFLTIAGESGTLADIGSFFSLSNQEGTSLRPVVVFRGPDRPPRRQRSRHRPPLPTTFRLQVP